MTDSSSKATHLHTPKDVLQRGLKLVDSFLGLSLDYLLALDIEDHDNHTKCADWFEYICGPDYATAADIWNDLQTNEIEDALVNVEEDGTCLEDFLMALYFALTYKTRAEIETVFFKSYATIRKWVEHYIPKIAALKADKIAWPQHLHTEAFTLGVIRCKISGHTMTPDPAYYDDQLDGYGFAYEIARTAMDDKCVWIKGPLPAGMCDDETHQSELRDKLLETNGVAIAGTSCLHEPTIRVANPHEPCPELKLNMMKQHNKFVDMIKRHQCLSSEVAFRHSEEMHSKCFEAVVVICQCQIEKSHE